MVINVTVLDLPLNLVWNKSKGSVIVANFYHNDIYTGADPGFFLGGGALVSCSPSTPMNHIVFFFFFFRIPGVLENCRSSQERGEGGAHPLHSAPRSAPDIYFFVWFFNFSAVHRQTCIVLIA